MAVGRPLALAALAGLLLCPGATAADHTTLTFSHGFAAATLAFAADSTGERAQQTRQAIDQNEAANQDGVVTPDEVRAFETTVRELYSQGPPITNNNLTLDDRKPFTVEIVSFQVTGAEGPVSSTEPLSVAFGFNLTFSVGNGPRHILTLQHGRVPANGTLTTTVVSDPTFFVANSTGLPSNAVFDPDGSTVTFTDGPDGQDETVVFDRREPGTATSSAAGAPAASFPVAALALAVALVVAQHRASRAGR